MKKMVIGAVLLAIIASLIVGPVASANQPLNEEVEVFGKPTVFVLDCPTVGGWKTVAVSCRMKNVSGLPETRHVRAFYRDQSGRVREIRRAAQDVSVLPEEMLASGCHNSYYYKGYKRELRKIYGRRGGGRTSMVWICDPYLPKGAEFYLWLEDGEGNKSEETWFRT
jgi:hypothetical protein